MLQLRNILSPDRFSGVTLKDATKYPAHFGMMSNDSGIDVNEKRALMHTAVFRAVTLLGGAIAGSPKHLMQRGDTERNRTVASNEPGHWVIYNRPNQAQNTFQFHFMAVAHLLLWGNFYAYINRDRYHEVTSIVPVMPWCVSPCIENGRKVFYVGGKRYTDNDMLHVYGLSINGFKGLPPIRYASESIGIGLAAQKMEASSFGSGMHAGGIVELPEDYAGYMGSTDEEAQEHMDKVRESFKKTYQDGPSSWHNMLFMEPGWKYTQFKMAFEIEKLVANKKYTVADIARMFNVPLHKLMEMDKATFSNIEHQNIEYVQDGVMPLAINFEAEYNSKLIKNAKRSDLYYKFNLDGLQRGDIKSRFEAYSIALGKNAPGWMEPEEVRDLEDLDAGNPENWTIPQNMHRNRERNAELVDA